jgi:CRISPR-associated protein Csb2
MSSFLCLTIRFLDPVPQFHGRGDDGNPEWPPSPLRVFQALVAAAATRWRASLFEDYARPALNRLEAVQPSLVAPCVAAESFGYRMYVPNNSGDLMTAAWARGDTETSMAKFRVEKDVRPTHIVGDAVHYLYPIADAAEFAKHRDTLVTAARSVTHLGWGVDMVAGNAAEVTEEEVAKLAGERWRPTPEGGTPLRVPRVGTLAALVDKHTAFLNRLDAGGFRPVPPLTAFNVVGYRRDTDSAAREWAAFRIASLDPDDKNPSFDTARRCRDVAAWVRNATGKVCDGWPFPDFASFVHGHAEDGSQSKGDRADERFMYLPLPTINHALNRVESIRRVLIAAPPGFRDRTDWIRQRLPGQELVWGEETFGMLNQLPKSDWVLKQYVGESRVWSTVTPVVLPGYDDRDDTTAERLLRRAFVHAGFSEEVACGLGLDWRNVGFRAGVDLASRFCLPDRLNGPRYHVRVTFPHPIRGPLAVGAGRYRGLGLFAGE